MAFDWTGFQNFITAFGSVLGIVSFIFVVDRWRKERPILKFRLSQKFYWKDKMGTHLFLKVYVDNLGERGTTINDLRIVSVDHEYLNGFIQTYYSDKRDWDIYLEPYEEDIPPHTTSHIESNIFLEDTEEIEGEINGELKIVWTHDEITIPFTMKNRTHSYTPS